MPRRMWMILDALQEPTGPFSDRELVPVLERLGDCYVFTDGMADWERASEVFARELSGERDSGLATDRVRPALDENAQPRNTRLNARRRADREVHELLGIAKGVIADGVVTDSEVVALQQWFDGHSDALEVWPVNVLSRRLRRILADGVVDEVERAEFADLLRQATGERPDGATSMRGATRLPLCDPPPHVVAPGRAFVLTGKFAFGSRARCADVVRSAGGLVKDGVTRDVHYLVIGTLGSADWAHSTHGRKIEKAVDLRTKGAPLSIMSEEHWCTSFGLNAAL